MKISIITTCFNRKATIRNAIESVLAQDYPGIEYIVVDGASTDSTTDIVREYDGRIAKIISEPDRGMYEAINKGIRAATGDVVGLLHSDDFFYDNHVVGRIAERMEETGADFLYGNGLFVDCDNTDKVVRNWIGGKYRTWKVRHGWLPLHPTCYIKRDVMLRRGLYNETYKIAADSDLLLRYLMGGDITSGDGRVGAAVSRAGKGGMSIYGAPFEDENLNKLLDRAGLLVSLNDGPNLYGAPSR